MNSVGPPFHLCGICGKILDLGNCKVDERGNAVHENCYVVTMSNSKPHSTEKPSNRFAESQQKSQELIEQTKKLLRQSGAIANKKYRSRWD